MQQRSYKLAGIVDSAKRAMDMALFLQEAPRTKAELCTKFLISVRTAERLLSQLKAIGFSVEKINKRHQQHQYFIPTKEYSTKRINDVIESTIDISGKKQGDIESILSSPYFRKKPFIEALYGKWTPGKAILFSQKMAKHNGNEFTDIERKKIILMLQNIVTNIEMAVL